MRADSGPSPSKPRPHRAGTGPARVVVRSLGTAGVSLVRGLRRVLPVSDVGIATWLLQAPSEILTGLAPEQAAELCKALAETGLDCAVALDGEAVEEGVGDYDVALVLEEAARTGAVLAEVMGLLGVDLAGAREVACRVPAVLLGGVSAATVGALRARFEALGVGLDASRPAEARYDIFLGECAPALRERALSRLRASVGEAAAAPAAGGLVLTGLDRAAADGAWRELRQLDVPARVINRDFARYDVLLERAEGSPALHDYLVARAGVPERVVPRVLANLPVVVLRGVPFVEAERALVELSALGAHAAAEPLAFQRFAVVLGAVADPRPLMSPLREIAGLDEAAALSALRERPARLPGPFTRVEARWLQHELKRAGVEARLVTA